MLRPARMAAQERTGVPPRVHRPLEGEDGHVLVADAQIFGHARRPVLDADEYAVAVVVSRVADVEWEAGVPVRWARASADVASCELEGDLLDDVG